MVNFLWIAVMIFFLYKSVKNAMNFGAINAIKTMDKPEDEQETLKEKFKNVMYIAGAVGIAGIIVDIAVVNPWVSIIAIFAAVFGCLRAISCFFFFSYLKKFEENPELADMIKLSNPQLFPEDDYVYADDDEECDGTCSLPVQDDEEDEEEKEKEDENPCGGCGGSDDEQKKKG